MDRKVTLCLFRLLIFFLIFVRFFIILNPFSYIFAAVIGLLLGLLPVQKILRKHQREKQISPWSSHVYSCSNFTLSFQSNFSAWSEEMTSEVKQRPTLSSWGRQISRWVKDLQKILID